MKKRWCSILTALLLLLPLAAMPASADAGPKPSVVVELTGLEGRTCWGTLLSQQEGTGPYGRFSEGETVEGPEKDRALRAMEAAAARGASLILFPEMFLTGYLIRDQLAQLAEPYPNGPALTVLGQKAKALSLGVVMGMPLANPGGKPYNAVVMIDRDGTPAGFQAKTHFFGGEEKMFAPGTSLRAFDTSFGRMGILVCYDGEFPETARSLALDGAKLICMCAANMSPYEDYHFLYMRTRAMENRAYTLYCNYVGDEKRFHYCGQSGAFHPTGRILAEAGTQEETTLYALIDMEDTTAPDDFLNYLHHRQPQLYHPALCR